MHHLVFLHIYSLGGTALLRLPSDLGWRSGMLGLACLLLGAAVLLFHSSGPHLVHLLLVKYTGSPLVVSSFIQSKQSSGHKENKAILSETEAQY